ncbi:MULTISPECIES: Lrp/AsnC family transcriptional regulator [Aeromicrobium]|uniref:Winged helix-turn-helix transcriptional regulator n=1 Tax=Aeromicrobium yanjiei TaxID=2662028 RepID=A0A5Q2MNJ4_9ACTN|nr:MULTISPECIES: Lrp/AsnC family transcriptional regulator [Aeromicrobium]MRK00238.1 winged helix-turn-helix transcriptional regulator [Aeromicrobium sp. S22]QGG42866.1 winged helix-turn-helix transcriptional regulator [Aeromicrobium yanjiei]
MAGAELDDIDERIVRALEADGRLSMRQLAEQVHISRANAYARVERLTTSGVITGFTATTDPVARGLGTSAYVTMNVRQTDWRSIHTQLRRLSGIEHIALVGGDFDVVLLARAKDNADLRRLVLDEIQAIPGVVNTRTLLIFEESFPHQP